APGTEVLIDGLNFVGVTAVKFAGQSATSISVPATTQIHATVPAGATNGPITVSTPQGTGSSSDNFLATTAPVITDVTPAIASPGSQIAIFGFNFSGVHSVLFNGTAAVFSAPATTQINATVPPTATSGPITVTTSAGSGTTPAL